MSTAISATANLYKALLWTIFEQQSSGVTQCRQVPYDCKSK